MKSKSISRPGKDIALNLSVVRDRNLSWEALGLLGYLVSHKDELVNIDTHLLEVRSAGRDQIRRITAELVEAGYVKKRVSGSGDSGKLVWTIEIDDEVGYQIGNMNATSRAPVCGYVYLIRDDAGLHKIGCSVSPQTRWQAINRKRPSSLIAYYPCKDMYDEEEAWHNIFNGERVFGEWFELDASGVSHFLDICNKKCGFIETDEEDS